MSKICALNWFWCNSTSLNIKVILIHKNKDMNKSQDRELNYSHSFVGGIDILLVQCSLSPPPLSLSLSLSLSHFVVWHSQMHVIYEVFTNLTVTHLITVFAFYTLPVTFILLLWVFLIWWPTPWSFICCPSFSNNSLILFSSSFHMSVRTVTSAITMATNKQLSLKLGAFKCT